MHFKDIDKTLLKKLTILYVEDDTNTREEITHFLNKIVGTVHIAENGQKGLEAFKKHDFDMVITDIQMPVMNGLEMVSEIRKLNKHIPVAVTTAFSDADFLVKAIECGVDKYIVKPVDMIEMATIIHKCTNYCYMEEKIEVLTNYSTYILNKNSSFMFIVNDGDTDYANEQLMHMLGINTYEEIQHKPLFILKEQTLKKQENWIAYIQEHQDIHYTVSFEDKKKKYYLTYKHFDKIKKSVFSFAEIEESNYLQKRDNRVEQP